MRFWDYKEIGHIIVRCVKLCGVIQLVCVTFTPPNHRQPARVTRQDTNEQSCLVSPSQQVRQLPRSVWRFSARSVWCWCLHGKRGRRALRNRSSRLFGYGRSSAAGESFRRCWRVWRWSSGSRCEAVTSADLVFCKRHFVPSQLGHQSVCGSLAPDACH